MKLYPDISYEGPMEGQGERSTNDSRFSSSGQKNGGRRGLATSSYPGAMEEGLLLDMGSVGHAQ